MGERETKESSPLPFFPSPLLLFFRQRSGLIAFQVRRSLAGRHGSWPSRWMRQGGRIARKRECALPRRHSVHNDNRARALEPVGAMIPRWRWREDVVVMMPKCWNPASSVHWSQKRTRTDWYGIARLQIAWHALLALFASALHCPSWMNLRVMDGHRFL